MRTFKENTISSTLDRTLQDTLVRTSVSVLEAHSSGMTWWIGFEVVLKLALPKAQFKDEGARTVGPAPFPTHPSAFLSCRTPRVYAL